LALLLGSIAVRALPAFFRYEVALDIRYDPALLDAQATGSRDVLAAGSYGLLVKHSLREAFPQVRGRRARRRLAGLVSIGAAMELRQRVLREPSLVGRSQKVWLPLDDVADLFFKGEIRTALPESQRKLGDAEIGWLRALQAQGRIRRVFNRQFLSSGDSREPELAGIRGALVGTAWTLLVTLLLAFPVGVAAAIYLEEFAPRTRSTDFIEVNINNLAAVPSIVFGLLGLSVFLDFLGMPRSAPLVGGIVLALMTLPTVIIAARSALLAVSPSIREAALGIGASPLQAVFHHVLPQALPGILTGTIIGMARALGETAPLLMIGMVAFIVDVPSGPLSPATVLPVQIFLWADSPERAFVAKTSAAILVLLVFLVAMNALAVLLRSRFERHR